MTGCFGWAFPWAPPNLSVTWVGQLPSGHKGFSLASVWRTWLDATLPPAILGANLALSFHYTLSNASVPNEPAGFSSRADLTTAYYGPSAVAAATSNFPQTELQQQIRRCPRRDVKLLGDHFGVNQWSSYNEVDDCPQVRS